MKNSLISMGIAAFLCLSYQQAAAQAGMLNKLKQKAENKAEQALDNVLNGKNKNDNSATGSGDSGNMVGGSGGTMGGGASGSRGRNTTGEGLISTPPDVKQQLADAEGAFKTKKYNDARYAIQQAMLGVEMEIGQKILKALPDIIAGMKKDEKVDQVTSMGWGWAGLTIQRQYNGAADKELRLMVSNSAAMHMAMNHFLTSGGYSQTTGGEQNWKQTKIKGHKAVIEYDEASGYKLSVPLGQSSLLIYEGLNFKNEQDLMAAANTVDIDNILKMLGE